MTGGKMKMEDLRQYIVAYPKHALVLGGSGGIGSEIVRAFAANGTEAITFTYGKNRAAAEQLKTEIESLGLKAFIGHADRADDKTFGTFLEEAVANAGMEIDAMVDAIGISPNTPLLEQTREEWLKVFNVNVFDTFHSTRSVLERMRQKGTKGAVVLITSTNGINSWASYSMHYDASKAALIPMVLGFSEEYARYNIRVNGVAPGWIETPMNDTLPPGEREKETAKIWLRRFAKPFEVATTVLFYASTGASFVTGQNVVVDGGYRG